MTNKIKFLLSLLVIGTGTTGIAMGATSLKTPLAMAIQANGTNYNTCGYINFGLDTDLATAESIVASANYESTSSSNIIKTSSSNIKDLAIVSGDAGVSTSKGDFDCAPLKFGTSKKGGSIVFNVHDNYSACYIWAAAWNNSATSTTINGVSQSIAADAGVANNSSSNITFTRYWFDNLESEEGKLSISTNKRLVIGAISFYK